MRRRERDGRVGWPGTWAGFILAESLLGKVATGKWRCTVRVSLDNGAHLRRRASDSDAIRAVRFWRRSGVLTAKCAGIPQLEQEEPR